MKKISRQQFMQIQASELLRNPMLAVTREPRPTVYMFAIERRLSEGTPRPRVFRKYVKGYRLPDRYGNA